MDSVVYLVRSPLEVISPFLYSKTHDATVIAVEKTPFLIGREGVAGCSYEKGTALSYSELLEVLIESHRVIAL